MSTTTKVTHPDGTVIECSTSTLGADAGGPLKFSYFPLKARGFPILLALEVGSVDYEAECVQFSEWGAMKASGVCPMGYLPLVTLADGTTVNETNACLMTVGNIAGLNGATAAEFGTSAMLACKAAEVFTELTQHQPTQFTVKSWSEEKATALAEWKASSLGKYLEQFAALCKDGRATESGTTVGELHLFSVLYHLNVCGCQPVDQFPADLQALYARLEALPAVKRCIASETKLGECGDYVVPVPK